jgi:prolyl-tRNA editing enzyme YbaK/EbsC (Cys-tRNA(Pro) deacylase)
MDIVKATLESSGVEYELIHHEQHLCSAADGAAFFDIDPGQTAPTLIVETDHGYVSIIFSGSRSHLDFIQTAAIIGSTKIQLVKRNKLREITGFDAGDMPMVGLNLPVIFDRRLFQYSFVYGGSGLPNRTLKISPKQLARLNNVIAYLEDDN